MKKRLLAVLIGFVVSLLLLEVALRIIGVFQISRVTEPASSQRDIYRIVCVGDSFTAGVGASFDKSYPRQLEELLNKHAFKKKIQVINRGVGSYNTSQIFNELQKSLKNKEENPDLVIILAGGANYWNYWGLYNVSGGNIFKSCITNFFYRVRVFKLAKLLFLQIKEKTRGAPAVPRPDTRVSVAPVPPKQVADIAPKTFPPDAEKPVDACAEGWRRIHLRDYEEAIVLFRKGLLVNPRDKDCYLGLGRAYTDLKNADAALAAYHQGLVMDPHNSLFYAGLGEVYSQQLKYHEALRFYSKGLAMDPHNGFLYLSVGDMYRYQSRFNDAILWFKKAIKVSPGDARPYMALGCTLCQGRLDYKQARLYIKKSLSLSQERLYWFSIFISSYPEQQRAAVLTELINEKLMPSWYMSEAQGALLRSFHKDSNLNQRIEQWITFDLEKMISSCRTHGVKVLLLTYPDYPAAPRVCRLLPSVAVWNSVPFIDFKPLFAELLRKGGKVKDYYAPDYHCNANGYGIMAQQIVEKLLRDKILDFK